MQTFLSYAAKMSALMIWLAFVGIASASAQGAREQAKNAAANGDFLQADSLYKIALKESPGDKEVLLEAGDVNMELERYAVARDIYQRALDLDKKDSRANRSFGVAASSVASMILNENQALVEHRRAIEALNRALQYDDKSVENYLALGHAYIAIGKDSLSKGELTFQKASQKFSNSPDVAVALGDLYYARQIYALAQEKFEEAIKLNSKLVEPRVKLGRAYRELARQEPNDSVANLLYNQALIQFNTVTSIAPKNAQAWREQGEIFMLAHEYQKAGQSFTEYVSLRPDDPRGDIFLARAAYGGNYYNLDIEPLERVLAKKDSVSMAFADSAHMMLAKSYYAVKNYAKARDNYALLKDTMDMATTKLYASSILNSGGDTLRAIELYRKLIDANPKDCDLSAGFGGLLYSMKRYEGVIDVFSKRMLTCPDAPKANPYFYIGLSNFSLKRYDQAIEALNNSIAADDTSSQVYYWLINAYASAKQYTKAAGVAKTMEDRGMDKTNPKAVATGYFFAGVDRFVAKDYKGAIAQLERSIRLNPENAQAYLYMAFSYQTTNDKDNACKYYKLTLKYDPKNADAAKNMKAAGCS